MNCAPTFKREMLKPISRGAIHRVRGCPPFVTVIAKYRTQLARSAIEADAYAVQESGVCGPG